MRRIIQNGKEDHLCARFFLALAIAVVLAALIVQSGFPYKLMDLNDSGFVSPREAIRALDLGTRAKTIEGQTCIEIYTLKDGLPLKQTCDEI